MFVTFFVSKFDTSSVVRYLQSSNMRPMFVTFSVFRYSIPSIFKLMQPRNQL